MLTVEKIKSALEQGSLFENGSIEFKLNIPNNWDGIARCIVGMANCKGGHIIFGIQEYKSQSKLIGIKRHITYQSIYEQLGNFIIGAKYTLKSLTIGNSEFLIIEIPPSATPAYFRRKFTSPERLIKYIRTSDGNQYENTAEAKMSYRKVYKYMNLETFLCCLYGNSWRFFEPSKWNDKYESRFYCADYNSTKSPENAKQLYASCVTRTKNSEAAWKIYANKEGLSCHCVQLELDVIKLRDMLISSGYVIDERPITYKPESYILNLHKRESKDYNEFFSPFTSESFIRLLSLKREAYTYEDEIRFFAIPAQQDTRSIRSNQAKFIDIPIDWKSLIVRGRIDKKCSLAELTSIEQACIYAGINPVIKDHQSILNTLPLQNAIDIEFEKFNIDEMPDTQIVKIE